MDFKSSSDLPKSPQVWAAATEALIAGLSLGTQRPWDPSPAGDFHDEPPPLHHDLHGEQTYFYVLILNQFTQLTA